MYKMRKPFDCGISGLAFVRSQINKTSFDDEYEILDQVWKFPKKDGYFTYIRDWPGAHYRVMTKLGMRWKLITPEELIHQCIPNRTVILLHGLMKLDIEIMDQHWAVIQDITGDNVNIHLGNGKTYNMSFQTIRNLYYRSFPNCMYVVGEGETNQCKWEQFVDWCASWIA